jgi:hypothetical protein
MKLYSLQDFPANSDVQLTANTEAKFIGPIGPNGYKRVPNSEVFFFRIGYFGYIKLNVESMILQSVAK